MAPKMVPNSLKIQPRWSKNGAIYLVEQTNEQTAATPILTTGRQLNQQQLNHQTYNNSLQANNN